MQVCNVNKLIICLIFASLAACSKDTSSTTTSPNEDLNNQHTEELINIGISVREQYSDLIEGLRAQETNDLFLPYIERYEEHKSSSIHSDIKIFFFDPSKLPENHAMNLFAGVCFYSERFIFIDWDYWFVLNPSENLKRRYEILERFSKDGTYKQSSLDRDGSISREVEKYEDLSEEEKQESIETVERLEERLSDEEKIAARDFRRELIVFHELGHCDLFHDHEMIKSSIMNYDTVALINNEAIKKEECQESVPYMQATKECRRIDIEVSYHNLVQELFSTEAESGDTNLLRQNPEAYRLFYQEVYQDMQIYADAIVYEVESDLSD